MASITPTEAEEIQIARASRALLERTMSDRRDKLLNKLISDYRKNEFKPDHALGFVAEMAGMEEQIDKLTRILRGAGQ